MMGNMMTSNMMMGNMMALYYPESKPITQDEALRNMESFARQYGSNVEVEDFMAFQQQLLCCSEGYKQRPRHSRGSGRPLLRVGLSRAGAKHDVEHTLWRWKG